MPVTQPHTIYAIKLGANVIDCAERNSWLAGTEIRGEGKNGEAFARFQSIVAQKPSGSFATAAVKKLLDQTTTVGANIAGFTGGLVAYAQAIAQGGSRASGSAHRSFTIPTGLIVPRTLSCQHQGDASIGADVIVIWAGDSAEPIIYADAVALAAIGTPEVFTLGPVTLAGEALDHVMGVDIDFGITARSEGSDSEVRDQFAWVQSIAPVITIRGIDPDWFNSARIPLLGLNGTHANTTIYFRKRTNGGSVEADGSPVHVKFTAAGLITLDSVLDGQGSEPAETTVRMQCKYDGTNNPLVVNTASAVS